MAPGLEEFCDDCRRALGGERVETALSRIAESLGRLCRRKDFIAATFAEDASPGKRELFRDPDLDFRVLAHVQAAGKAGKPHDHGASWAVYGAVMGVTRMTDWRRLNSDPDHVELQPARTYDLEPGQAHFYGPHALHSTEHPRKAWVLRVTGGDLDAIPRYHFRSKSDRLVDAQ